MSYNVSVMVERYSPKSQTRVGRETLLQYGESWPLSADIRRHLTLKYSNPQRDMWSEIAKSVVESGAKRVVEFGSSSGYIIRKMLEHGFEGEIVGIEKEDSYLPLAEELIRREFPETKANVKLMPGDAQYITLGDLGGEPFDAGIAANLLYHVPAPKLVFKNLNEIVRDQGLQFFSTKDLEHQQEIWMFANQIVPYVNAQRLHSFYWHFPTSQLDQSIKQSKKFRPLTELKGEHISETLIPDDEEGWDDFKLTVLSLVPIMEDKQTGQQPNIHRCIEILESPSLRDFTFRKAAQRNGGYFKGTVSMSWRACENLNPNLR